MREAGGKLRWALGLVFAVLVLALLAYLVRPVLFPASGDDFTGVTQVTLTYYSGGGEKTAAEKADVDALCGLMRSVLEEGKPTEAKVEDAAGGVYMDLKFIREDGSSLAASYRSDGERGSVTFQGVETYEMEQGVLEELYQELDAPQIPLT